VENRQGKVGLFLSDVAGVMIFKESAFFDRLNLVNFLYDQNQLSWWIGHSVFEKFLNVRFGRGSDTIVMLHNG
jgi:hypothetical protein